MNPKTAAKWVDAYNHCQRHNAPLILRSVVEKKYKVALRALVDAPKKTKIRAPRGVKVKTPQAVKKDLRKELEALCKAIVFTRDCGSPEAREGNCISCAKRTTLQWGHFIRQQDSKWLQYDPRNTGAQCGGCNGFLHGNVLKYADAIDRRDGHGAARRLREEAEYMDARWRPNKTTLGEMLRKLQTHPLAPKAKPARSAEQSESHPSTTPERTPTCTPKPLK